MFNRSQEGSLWFMDLPEDCVPTVDRQQQYKHPSCLAQPSPHPAVPKGSVWSLRRCPQVRLCCAPAGTALGTEECSLVGHCAAHPHTSRASSSYKNRGYLLRDGAATTNHLQQAGKADAMCEESSDALCTSPVVC